MDFAKSVRDFRPTRVWCGLPEASVCRKDARKLAWLMAQISRSLSLDASLLRGTNGALQKIHEVFPHLLSRVARTGGVMTANEAAVVECDFELAGNRERVRPEAQDVGRPINSVMRKLAAHCRQIPDLRGQSFVHW